MQLRRLAFVEIVILEIADQFRGALLLETLLEPSPRRGVALAGATLGDFHILYGAVEIELLFLWTALVLFVLIEFV